MKEVGERHGCFGCFEQGVDYIGFDLDGQYVITSTAEDCQKKLSKYISLQLLDMGSQSTNSS